MDATTAKTESDHVALVDCPDVFRFRYTLVDGVERVYFETEDLPSPL